ncbi:unnamed protein product [Rotaria socialis]|uniref:Uncharacterized protein n=1 Tax=Rotaria socialis TaxID=392032 RepID=A0A818D8E5_9BILA|nr:unnamed protein product [Rotaria socialis]CAF4692143.1 unnamed protein product [Rotaria socialis]
MNEKIDTSIRRAAEHLYTYMSMTNNITYELNDQLGIFKAWCLLEHELVQIKIKVSRIFHVNCCTLIELNSNQTQPSANYKRIIHNCSQAYYLYEYHLAENIFHDYYTDIMTD